MHASSSDRPHGYGLFCRFRNQWAFKHHTGSHWTQESHAIRHDCQLHSLNSYASSARLHSANGDVFLDGIIHDKGWSLFHLVFRVRGHSLQIDRFYNDQHLRRYDYGGGVHLLYNFEQELFLAQFGAAYHFIHRLIHNSNVP